MTKRPIVRLASLKSVNRFQEHLREIGVSLPCDAAIMTGEDSILLQPLICGRFRIRNRIAVQPMEGWDGTADGNPSERTIQRWRRFGRSGAGLIWGCEAVAVSHDGRANPNQLVIANHSLGGLEKLRRALIQEYRSTTGANDEPLIGLQLTHSGRYSRPNEQHRKEPQILYHHPILDKRVGVSSLYRELTDSEIGRIVEDFHGAAAAAAKLGFDFVDIKHCHGYLGHEFLSAHTRQGIYGGSFENRTRFLRRVVEGVRAVAPNLELAVRLSAFDSVPFRPDPDHRSPGVTGTGVPEDYSHLIPYRWGFGVEARDPKEMNLEESEQFIALLQQLGIRLVNITAGSPY